MANLNSALFSHAYYFTHTNSNTFLQEKQWQYNTIYLAYKYLRGKLSKSMICFLFLKNVGVDISAKLSQNTTI